MSGGRLSAESRRSLDTQTLRRSGRAARRSSEGHGSRSRRREAARPGFAGSRMSAEEVEPAARCGEVSPGVEGRAALSGAVGSATSRAGGRPLRGAGGGARSSFGSGGDEDPRSREGRWRGRSPGEERPGGAGRPESSGTDSRREQRFEAGEAGGSGRPRRSRPRVTGSQARAWGKGAHSQRGNQATARSRVGVGETAGERLRAARTRTPVDDREGAGGPERGPRSS